MGWDRTRCEVCVERITELMESKAFPLTSPTDLTSDKSQDTSGNTNGGDKIVMHEQRVNIVNELSQTPVGVCPLLRRTILHGVAYHHAGLTVDERKVIYPKYIGK